MRVLALILLFAIVPATPAGDEKFVFSAQEGKPFGDAAPGVKGLLKTVEGFRKELPPPATPAEGNGRMIKDADGNYIAISSLYGVATRLQVKTKGECLVLLSYLNDRDVKIRVIVAQAIEKVVGAYPGGMSIKDMTEIDSDGHRELIRRFAEKIGKLTE